MRGFHLGCPIVDCDDWQARQRQIGLQQQQAGPLTTRSFGNYEHDVGVILAFIQLDANSKVAACRPTDGTDVSTTTYTRALGMQKSIGNGTIVTQPWSSAGVFLFTLDEPWIALVGADVQLIDQGAVNAVLPAVDANVTGSTTSGEFPGNNGNLAVQTVRVRFRSTTGTLTDLIASTGYWLTLFLKRSGVKG
jgi:hypothetical protein